MTDTPLRILVIGAHPDDAELHVGGIMALYRRLGHVVKIISVTDGAAGHHALLPDALRKVRAGELTGSAAVIGAELEFSCKPVVLDCLENGMLINCTHDTVLRFLPPYIVTEKDVDAALKVLGKIFAKAAKTAAVS